MTNIYLIYFYLFIFKILQRGLNYCVDGGEYDIEDMKKKRSFHFPRERLLNGSGQSVSWQLRQHVVRRLEKRAGVGKKNKKNSKNFQPTQYIV